MDTFAVVVIEESHFDTEQYPKRSSSTSTQHQGPLPSSGLRHILWSPRPYKHIADNKTDCEISIILLKV